MPARRALLAATLAALAGCTTAGEFPSLLPRPVEQLSFEEPVRVDPPVAPDAALSARANALLAEARRGDGAFETAYAEALPRVRAGGPTGSDSWVQAQEAISRVETARGVTTGALADLERLIADQSDDPVNDEIWRQIVAARESARALADDQNRRLGALRGSVRAP